MRSQATDLAIYKPAALSRERRQVSREELRAKYRRSLPTQVLIVSDATGSMAPYWNEVIRTINEIIRRLLSVGGDVKLKIVAYRDHCDGERILEYSPWSSQADELKRWLGTITCDGGGDAPEAVDRGLQVALAEQEVSRVILIGDAPPHVEQDCTREARELGQKNQPVYPIVIGRYPETRAAFAQIAQLSGGKMIELDNLDELFEFITILATAAMGPEAIRRYQAQYALSTRGQQLLLELHR